MEDSLTFIEGNFGLVFNIIYAKIEMEGFYRHKYTFSSYPPIQNLPKKPCRKYPNFQNVELILFDMVKCSKIIKFIK